MLEYSKDTHFSLNYLHSFNLHFKLTKNIIIIKYYLVSKSLICTSILEFLKAFVNLKHLLLYLDNIRDFTDTLILARKEAEEDPDEADLDKLTDTHIIQTLSDIFFGKKKRWRNE